MAGIGFKLKSVFEKDTYFDTLKGVVYSTAVAGGPIFFSILCLILLGIFSAPMLTQDGSHLFLVTIVYVFCFSLISTGFSQLLVTRYLSDLLYMKKNDQVLPAFTSVVLLTITLQFILCLPFILSWDIDLFYKLTALMLFIVVGCIWQLMIFLSAVRSYKAVLFAFLIGLSVSFFLAIFLGNKFGLNGLLHGYTVGQIILLMILMANIYIDFKSDAKPNLEVLSYVKEMPLLILIGLLYNMGIWADKIVFWFGPKGEHIQDFFFAFADYDGATFVSFLTVIPSYTYFLVRVETDFYTKFKEFYAAVLGKSPLGRISEQKNKIAVSVKDSFIGLIKLQGAVTLVCVLFADEIGRYFNLPILGTLILEKAFIAVFLQMLLLTVMIFLMYFDIKKQLLVVAAIFFFSNTLFTLISINLGYVYYGYGYLYACLLALIAGFIFLHRHLNDLEFHTFAQQPAVKAK